VFLYADKKCVLTRNYKKTKYKVSHKLIPCQLVRHVYTVTQFPSVHCYWLPPAVTQM